MMQSNRKKISALKKSSKLGLLFLLLLSPFFLTAQQHIIFKSKTDQEVLAKLSQKLDLVFNYNHDILSNSEHNFSVSGDVPDILATIENKLNINVRQLEENIYAINARKENTSEADPVFSFKVIDEEGGPLPYCNIQLPALDKIFQTDLDGNCSISGYYGGQEVMEISYLGFETVLTKVEELKKSGTLQMKTALHVLGEIVISEFLSSLQNNDIGNQERLNDIEIAGLSDQDILAKAQLLPGIHSSSESLNDLQIRGGPPDQVSYKWNNIRLLQTSLFYGKISGVNPFLVDEISITRNGASADQSGQASGSISLEASNTIAKKVGVKLFSDLLYANVGLQLPLIKNKLSAKIAFRKSHNYLFDSKIYQDYFNQTFQFGQLTNDQFYIDLFDIRGQEEIEQRFTFNDLSAHLNWRPHTKTKVSAALINIGNRFQYDYFDGLFTDNTKRDQLEISNLGWSINSKHQFSPHLSLNALYNGSRYENHYLFLSDINQESQEDRFKENDVQQHQWRADFTYKHKAFKVNIGAQKEHWTVGYIDTTRNASLGLSYEISQVSTEEQSAFAVVKWTFIPRTVIETGIRYSDFGFSLVDRKFIEPRLHLSHNLLPQLTLHAHFGQFHQNLNRRLFSTPLEVEKGIWYLSDERPESNNFIWIVQNRQSSLGLKYLIKNWKFTADAYTKKAENIWTSALDFAVEEDPFAFADLFVKGLEFSTHYQDKNWRLLWTYELTDETMTVKLEETYDIKSPFTQRHKFSLLQAYRKGPWTISTRWRYNSGRRFSKGAQFVIETEPELYYGLEYESILEEQVSPFHRLDLSVHYKWILNTEKKRWLELGLHLQNVYNRKNIIKRQFFIDYTKTPFEMSSYDREGLGFVPNFSMRLEL